MDGIFLNKNHAASPGIPHGVTPLSSRQQRGVQSLGLRAPWSPMHAQGSLSRFMVIYVSGWWYTYPSEKWWSSSVGVMKFPTEWKIKNVPFMFQTTNQMVSKFSSQCVNCTSWCGSFLIFLFLTNSPISSHPKMTGLILIIDLCLGTSETGKRQVSKCLFSLFACARAPCHLCY